MFDVRIREVPESVSILLRPLVSDERVRLLSKALGDDVELYLVGGAVRDALLERGVGDLDLTVNLHPTEILERLEAASIRCIPTGLQHQTLTTVPIADKGSIEVTSFHGPEMSPDGGASVGSSIEEDLGYRDFSVNAIAVHIQTGELVSTHESIQDLNSGVIRCAGVPQERFMEDPLRVMRMVRFACQLDFEIESETALEAQAFVGQLSSVSIERIRDELEKILLSPCPERGLQLLQTLGVFSELFPEIEKCVGFEQNRFHKADVFVHTLEVVKNTRADIVLRWAALLHDIGKPPTLSVDDSGDRHFYRHEAVGAKMVYELFERIRQPKSLTKDVATLVKTHMRPIECGPGGMRRLLKATDELYPLWRELKEADSLACKIDSDQMLAKLKVFDEEMVAILAGPPVHPLSSLAVNGDDLMAAGVEPGPKIGEVLRALHEKVLDDPELNEKNLLLKLISEV